MLNPIKRAFSQFLGYKRYCLDTRGVGGGPAIFAKRLKTEFKKQGWVYDRKRFEYNLILESGNYYPGKINILRLDGLAFDTENTLGDTEEINMPRKKAYYQFDKIIFQCEFSRKMFFHHFGETNKHHKIIYNGVPESFSPTGKKYKFPFDKTLICSAQWETTSGTQRTHKRLKAIIEGFKKLKESKNSNVGLVVIGECSNMDKVENIIYMGRIAHHKLPLYLRGADAFIHLSWLDWCPNTVVEALACGLPVFCGHNGGTKELVRDSGVILELEETYNYQPLALYKPPMPDPELVAEGMNKLLEWNKNEKPVVRPDLYIDHVAKKYIEFMSE